MSKLPEHYLRHILDEIDFLQLNLHNLTKEQFFKSDLLRRAFVRSLEIIGEAAKKLPQEFKNQHMEIDWKSIAGTRDKLIHGYFGIDYDIVWDILKNEIPSLKNDVDRILFNQSH